MSRLGLGLFDNAVKDANTWLNELMEILGWEDKERAYRLLRAVLQTVRDNLVPNEAADLGDQLPTLVRGIYYESYVPGRTPAKLRKRDAFIEAVARRFAPDRMETPEREIGAVLALLARHVSKGEIEDVARSFTEDVRALFPAYAPV